MQTILNLILILDKETTEAKPKSHSAKDNHEKNVPDSSLRTRLRNTAAKYAQENLEIICCNNKVWFVSGPIKLNDSKRFLFYLIRAIYESSWAQVVPT